MKAVCTWNEVDGATFGPLKCDAEFSVLPNRDKVNFNTVVKLDVIEVVIQQMMDVECLKSNIAYLSGRLPNDFDNPVMDDKNDSFYIEVNENGGIIDVHSSEVESMINFKAQLTLNKSEIRGVRFAMQQTLNIMEDFNGYIDLDKIPADVAERNRTLGRMKKLKAYLDRSDEKSGLSLTPLVSRLNGRMS